MTSELIRGDERPLKRVEHRDRQALQPSFCGLSMLNWSYTRTEIYLDRNHARINAERKTFEDGRLVSERFRGNGTPADFWRVAEQMQQQMLATMKPWLGMFGMYLPAYKEDKLED